MSWLSLSFEVPSTEVDAVTDALLEAGALAVDVEDAAAGSDSEEPLYAEAGGMERAWRRSLVRALVAGDADARAIFEQACRRAAVAPPSCGVEAVADRDWVRATQVQFVPIRISSRLWIVPSWHAAPDPDAVNIILDPGLAFGTGEHPTTRLCLNWLEGVINGGESVIDYGCGSGILAIAAVKLGADSALGIDIDEQALLAARWNAIQNQVRVEFRAAADRAGRAADIVVANILFHPLIVLAPLLAGLTAPRGRLALAGILGSQAAEVCATYGEWFDIGKASEHESWVLLEGVRKSVYENEYENTGALMAMVTRCPECNTTFRVAPSQLQAQHGMVRCGRCMAVFDGFKSLSTTEAVPEAAASPAAALAEQGPDAAPTALVFQLEPVSATELAAAAVEPARDAVKSESWDETRDFGPAPEQLTIDDHLFLEENRETRSRSARWWAAGAAFLLLVLAGQAIYVYRGELAAHVPWSRSYLTQMCNLIKCSVFLPQRPRLIAIEASDLQANDPARPALIQLTATVRNHAGYDVGYPALDLVLTNTREHTLARRIFLPGDYLEPGRDVKAGIPASAELTIRLDLDTGDLNPAGFRLDLLAAPTP